MQTFVRVFLPLSLPGRRGGVLVFIFSLGFITPAIPGRRQDHHGGQYINHTVHESLRWGVGTMLATTPDRRHLPDAVRLSRIVDLRTLFGAK